MSQNNRYLDSAQTKKKTEKANKHINFVVIAYVVILFYLLFLIYINFTKDTIHFVYAEPGSIYNDASFNGLIIKNEKVVYSSDSGPVKYFVPEGSKVRQNSYVCAVNQDPETEQIIQDQINQHLSELNDARSITFSDYSILQDKIREYVLDKPNENINFVYDSKDILTGTLLDISQTVYVKDESLFRQIQEEIAINVEQQLNNGDYYSMETSGVVGYTFDGFESYNIDNYDYSILNKEVVVNDVALDATVSEGEELYKIIDNYLIHVVSEIDPYCMKFLQDKIDNNKDETTLYFPRKNISTVATIYDLETIDGRYYVTFEVNKYFDEFFSDRFIDYRIKYDDYSGLKIPNEAVTTKALIQVPKQAIFEEKGSYKINKKVYTDDDVTHESSVSVNIKVYYEDNSYAYINSMDTDMSISPGDQVLYTEDESAKVSEMSFHTVGEAIDVEGVYVLNKGYSDFKRIKTLYEDETFRIIDESIGYSVGLYDKIASDASETSEFTTIN